MGSNCFVKFVDPAWGEDGLRSCRDAGYTADFAKRELEFDVQAEGGRWPAQRSAPREVGQWPAQKFHSIAPAGAIATTALAGAPDGAGACTLVCKIEGQSTESVTDFLSQLPGFEALKVGAGGRTCFVKLFSHADAQQALGQARIEGYTLDFAKRELNPGTPEGGYEAGG